MSPNTHNKDLKEAKEIVRLFTECHTAGNGSGDTNFHTHRTVAIGSSMQIS